jgi:hypothetical protein
MRNGLLTIALVALLQLCAGPVSSAADDLRWAFKAKAADGYSIDLVSVTPTPGTPLIHGSQVEFRITVRYSLTIAKTGVIVLVFQDDENRNVQAGSPQVTQPVRDASGTVTLTESITVPADAKELRLFVPLVPDGIKNTSGEVTIRYPLKDG